MPNTGGLGKRNRSFGGCTTCRRRRLKCSEQRPKCVQCTQAGRTCDYGRHLFFESDDRSATVTRWRYRRPLLAEHEQQSMSQQLAESIPPALALPTIEHIHEIYVNSSGKAGPDETHKGPFGAFRVTIDGAGELPLKGHSVNAVGTGTEEVFDPAVARNGNGNSRESCSTIVWSPRTLAAIDGLLECTGPLEAWAMPLDSPGVVIEEWDHGLSLDPALHIEQVPASFSSPQSLEMRSPAASVSINHSITLPSSDELQMACVLLKHYLTHVLVALTPYRHGKSPWHILWVPLVKECLAGRALNEGLEDAVLTVFYGTLALSALSLGAVSESAIWSERSRSYLKQARRCHARALASAYDLPKPTKYKSQLMATLTMLQLALARGDRDSAHESFLEAEKFIRIRGLNRRKSRKVRLLHHCYTYERIFYESMRLEPTHTRQDRRIWKEIESRGAHIYSKDARTFVFPTLEDLSSKMLVVKDRELGENDLHLQYPGLWPASQYLEIHGIPESYVLIVSLIIRLARQREDGSGEGGHDDNAEHRFSVQDFRSRAKMIEQYIKTQRRTESSGDPQLDLLMDATHTAITIYFYRAIHDLDSSMLQTKALEVGGFLRQYDALGSKVVPIRLIWPAFIAACEVEDPAARTVFAQWFAKGAQQGGLRVFDETMANVERIWQARREGSGPIV